jgi:hypothetical protein
VTSFSEMIEAVSLVVTSVNFYQTQSLTFQKIVLFIVTPDEASRLNNLNPSGPTCTACFNILNLCTLRLCTATTECYRAFPLR